MPRLKNLNIKLSSSKEMCSWGKQLAATLKPGDTVALIGPLGSGKTTLVQGIAAGWNYKGDVTSPTFAVANEYATPKGAIYHMDMYRLSRRECAIFPLEDYWDGKSLCLIEWADKVESRWPDRTIEIHLKHLSENVREAKIKRRR